MTCSICDRIERIRAGAYPNFLHEFEHSYLVAGDHQFFPGYCLVMLKAHVRDMHELDRQTQLAFFGEVMDATEAMVKALRPAKVNHSCYGNQDPHLHWHIFPRYADDPDRMKSPWQHADQFDQYLTKSDDVDRLKQAFSTYL